MKLRCLIKKHEWITGRVAERWARDLVPKKSSYHNRACKHCSKEEWNADNVEVDAEKILTVKEALGYTRKQVDLDSFDKSVDPDEFP